MRCFLCALCLAALVAPRVSVAADGPAEPPRETSRDAVAIVAGDLELVLDVSDDGIKLQRLHDTATGTALGAATPLPLFAITLRAAGAAEDVVILADQGWQAARAVQPAPAADWQLQWQGHTRLGLHELGVTAQVTPDPAADALRWTLRVDVPARTWGVRRVVFPQVAVRRWGPEAEVLFPRGAGEVKRGGWQAPFRFAGTYATGWTAMQMMAAYDPARRTGLYVAMHDPHAATKDLRLESTPGDESLVLAYEHPAPHMDQSGNDYQLSGQAVWQILRGDWFDAAQVYRRWVLEQADWSPALGPQGREDTPLWMRQLPLWALASGSAETVVPQVEAFADFFGVPVGVHWYNWHEIPFDNDYPHYFPTKPGFAEGVARLQQREIYVMPYINGRLWDTRDQGAEDRYFSQQAKPAATKNEAGEPYVETYGSKESDGSSVQLAVMCPDNGRVAKQGSGDRGTADGRVWREGRLHRSDRGGPTPAVLRPLARPPQRRRSLVDSGLLGPPQEHSRAHGRGPDADDRVQRRAVRARV